MHDLAPGRSATAVGRRCGCARARYAAVQSSVAQLTAACAGPALGGGPARRQPDQTQAADSMALTWPRTVKASGTRPRLSPMFCAGAERSLTVQPPWNWQPRHDSGVCCGRTFREPATPLQIQTVFFSHVLLIRLFQHTPICSVGTCLARPSPRISPSFSGSSAPTKLASSIWRPAGGRTGSCVHAALGGAPMRSAPADAGNASHVGIRSR